MVDIICFLKQDIDDLMKIAHPLLFAQKNQRA